MGSGYPFEPCARSNHGTEWAAASSMVEGSDTQRRALFNAVSRAGPSGLTSDEASSIVGLDHHYMARPRMSELVAAGRIIDSGQRRRNKSGRMAVVWCLPKYKCGPDAQDELGDAS